MSFKYDEHNKYHRFARLVVITAISLTVFVFLWAIVAKIADTAAVQSPSEAFDALVYLLNNPAPVTGFTLEFYLSNSLQTFFKGFLVALAAALPIGLLMGRIKIFREFMTPIIEVLRPIAPIAWAPILLFALKSPTTGSMMVVAIGVFFPLLTNIVFGVTKIDKNLIDAAKTLGATDMQIFVKILVPSVIPYLMNGIKVGLGIGWMCIVAAEMWNPSIGGIGSFVAMMAELTRWRFVYAGIIVIGALGLLTTGVADYLHRWVSKRMGVDA